MSKSKFNQAWGAVENQGKLVIARVKRTLAGSTWAPLAGRGTAYLLGFAMLAVVGSGRLARWISPSVPRLGISVAEAATVPPRIVKGLPEAASAVELKRPPPSREAPGPEAAATGEAADMAADVASAKADAGAPPASNAVAADGKVILNLAAEDDLRRLPGIGRTRAQAILALRGRMKKFTQVEDLLKVKGIGRRSLARLRPMIRVD